MEETKERNVARNRYDISTEAMMAALNLTRTGLSSLANRNDRGKLKIGKDGKTHRYYSEEDLEWMRERLGKRGRPRKEGA